MRKRSEIIADALLVLDFVGSDSDLRAELEELHTREVANESVNATPVEGELPIYMIALAQDATALDIKFSRKMSAILILRPDDVSNVKTTEPGVGIEFLLPRDLGDRVFGNWRITEAEKCDTYEIEAPGGET